MPIRKHGETEKAARRTKNTDDQSVDEPDTNKTEGIISPVTSRKRGEKWKVGKNYSRLSQRLKTLRSPRQWGKYGWRKKFSAAAARPVIDPGSSPKGGSLYLKAKTAVQRVFDLKFKEKIINYIESIETVAIKDKSFFVNIKSAADNSNLIFTEIFISFTLEEFTDGKSRPDFNITKMLKFSAPNEVENVIQLTPEQPEYFGDQTLSFTFTNFFSYQTNIEGFIKFIQNSYQSPEEIKKRNREFWSKQQT